MILVIGATGTVGTQVVRQLIARGRQPRALVRTPEMARQRLGEQVELVVGDLDRPETLTQAFDGVERVFLLTVPSTQQLEQERAVIEAATRAGVGQIVRLSRVGAAEHSPLHIARFHWQAEQQLARSGLAFTIFRAPMFMQNLFFMVRDGVISSAMGDGRAAMLDARDVAAVAVAVLTGDGGDHGGRTYVPTGPQALGLEDAARMLSGQIGREIRYARLTPDDVRQGFLAMGVESWLADDAATLDSLLAAGHDEPVTDDVRKLTGHPPRTLATFARDFAPAFQPAQAR